MLPGCRYHLFVGRRLRRTVRVREAPNPVDGLTTVECDGGKLMRIDTRKYRVERARASTKSDTTYVYLYLCAIGNGYYKLGASADPSRRARQLRTGAADARLLLQTRLPLAQSRRFRQYEMRVLEQFAHCRAARGGTEVLRLTPAEVERCKRAMRACVVH